MRISNRLLYNSWMSKARSSMLTVNQAEWIAIKYAIAIANQVEASVENGEDFVSAFEDARETCKDKRGITKLMYQKALAFLCHCWEHGPRVSQEFVISPIAKALDKPWDTKNC